MKSRIIQADLTEKVCSCGNNIFRQTTKSRKTDEKHGITYTVRICDKCGLREEFNQINWTTAEEVVGAV